jgi:protein-disulfide isomerase
MVKHKVKKRSKKSVRKKDSETITLNKDTVWKAITGILALLLLISLFTGGFGMRSDSKDVQVAQKAQPRQAPTVDMDALIDDDSIKGDKDAPVTIVEFSDYECPFCARFYSQTYGQIDEEYIKTGKVKLVYRDFPLSFHRNAQKAAEAAECAGEQDKYYEMHDKLFEDGVTGGVSAFKQYASDLELDTNDFNDCLDSGEMAGEVTKDFQDGQVVGITGTPGFIINGQLVSGAQPFSAFKQVIDAELAK